MKVKSILSKSISLVTVFAMTFNLAFAQVDNPEVAVEESTEFVAPVVPEEPTTEPEATESEPEEGFVEEVLGAFTSLMAPQLDIVEMPAPTGPGSITVCKAIAKKVGDEISIADPSEVPGYTFTIPWEEKPEMPGNEGFIAQPLIATDAVFTTDGFTPEKAFFGEVNDSDCVKFSNLPIGSYFYGEEKITGGDDSVTWTTKYSDQVLLPVDAFEDVDEYNDNLFTSGFDPNYEPGNKDADGVIFNTNADGHIILNNSNAGKHRTIVVLNIFEEKQNEDRCDADVNLLTNGGFEAPVVTAGQGWDVYDSGTPTLGWNVAWNGAFGGAPATAKLELHRGVNAWAHDEGQQHAELDADWGYNQNEQASVVISQDVSTIVGNEYELSYAFSPRPGTGAGENKLEVWVDGALVDTQGPVAGGGNTSWNTYTVNFVADSSTTTIMFKDAGTPNSVGTFLDDVSVRCLGEATPEDVTIVAQKIVCLYEQDLPNWGNGGPAITSTTASDFVANHENCSLVEDWDFEWAYYNTPNPGDNDTGPTGGAWNIFTDEVNVPMPEDTSDDTKLWVREVLPEGYIPFTFNQNDQTNVDNVSAEIYCHTDVLNYDNYERIDGLVEGGTYNCVAWNVEVDDNEPSCEETQSCDDDCDVEEKCFDDNCEIQENCDYYCQEEDCNDDDGEPSCEETNTCEPETSNSSSSNSSGSQKRGSVLGSSDKGDVLGACVPFTEYHRKGDVGGEIPRIQEFLNEQIGAGLTVNGNYDDATVKAVHAFQKKYFEQVISPWVPSFLARTTGKWYKTTRMMANELIACPEAPVFLEDPKIIYKVKWNAEVKQN